MVIFDMTTLLHYGMLPSLFHSRYDVTPFLHLPESFPMSPDSQMPVCLPA